MIYSLAFSPIPPIHSTRGIYNFIDLPGFDQHQVRRRPWPAQPDTTSTHYQQLFSPSPHASLDSRVHGLYLIDTRPCVLCAWLGLLTPPHCWISPGYNGTKFDTG